VKTTRWTVLLLAVIGGFGCDGLENFIAPLSTSDGQTDVGVVFFNETPYNISTYWGVYNPLDATNGVEIYPLILGAGESSADNITAAKTSRRLEVAGASLRRAAEIGKPTGIDPTLISDTVVFTDPATGETVGTAPSARFLLGVDFSAMDLAEIHFAQVPNTTDQFAVDIYVEPEEE